VSRRKPAPDEARVREALAQMRVEAESGTTRVSVVGLARRLGMSNATFLAELPRDRHRNPASTRDLRQADPRVPAGKRGETRRPERQPVPGTGRPGRTAGGRAGAPASAHYRQRPAPGRTGSHPRRKPPRHRPRHAQGKLTGHAWPNGPKSAPAGASESARPCFPTAQSRGADNDSAQTLAITGQRTACRHHRCEPARCSPCQCTRGRTRRRRCRPGL
jgi:hypothetical protein